MGSRRSSRSGRSKGEDADTPQGDPDICSGLACAPAPQEASSPLPGSKPGVQGHPPPEDSPRPPASRSARVPHSRGNERGGPARAPVMAQLGNFTYTVMHLPVEFMMGCM
jgi:hypothetical protein